MAEDIPQEKMRFNTPEEELSYLREQVARKERELLGSHEAAPREETIRRELEAYKSASQEEVTLPERVLSREAVGKITLALEPEEHDAKVRELMALAEEKGIRSALAVAEKMDNPHVEDDFHRFLVEYIKEGFAVPGLKERAPLWKTLHMTLYEVVLPEESKKEEQGSSLKELVSGMEQFYAGMLSGADGTGPAHFTFEIALADKTDEIIFYAAVPDHKKNLFEKQLLAIVPNAELKPQKNDYNIFVEGGAGAGSLARLRRDAAYPLKTYDFFGSDPQNVILNAFSKIEKEGGGAALQVVVHPPRAPRALRYKEILKKMREGMSAREALKSTPETLGGAFLSGIKELVIGVPAKKKEEEKISPPHIDQAAIEQVEQKVQSPVAEVGIRLIASARDRGRAREILSDLESAFNQFENTQGNKLVFTELSGGRLRAFFKQFSFREFSAGRAMPLTLKELVTLIRPQAAIAGTPQFRQLRAKTAPAPLSMHQTGTFLGVNRYRGAETNVYLTKEDRLRHFYCVGQTGTGKTTLLKNMIAQDIAAGEGVCMIDPHGADIQDVLGMVPDERLDDVIYFDPSNLERVMALNMLEYDPGYPEQKTFVINELFSIFQKLYGAVPESMGPIFEQYFRNATALVLEDPASGSTLLDVSRVLADSAYRELKLSRCKNPVVKQFWEDIAAKAGGESSLANIVPYITSKFDVFTANDYMRPIIAQQKSSLSFRRIMDDRKILLVNLAKGRLGDINSNLLGLILVGKILMAALSRVDAVGRGDMPPFYLYIDEFQNVTTDSVATILSEARKYKLSLNVAHQFIAQLDERIRNAVFGNVGSLAIFRVGSDDAEFLARQFEPVFGAGDLVNIENLNAYVRILVNGAPAKPFNISIPFAPKGEPGKIERIKQLSYERYGAPREEVERAIQQKYMV